MISESFIGKEFSLIDIIPQKNGATAWREISLEPNLFKSFFIINKTNQGI